MASGRDKKGDQQGGGPAEAPSGRITVDSRGRNVWQWENENESTSILLKQLENDALALEPTRKLRQPDVAPADAKAPERGADGRDRGGHNAAEAGAGARPAGATREPGDRIRQYPDRAGPKPRGGDGPKRDIGKPAGPPRRGGGFDPYNSG